MTSVYMWTVWVLYILASWWVIDAQHACMLTNPDLAENRTCRCNIEGTLLAKTSILHWTASCVAMARRDCMDPERIICHIKITGNTTSVIRLKKDQHACAICVQAYVCVSPETRRGKCVAPVVQKTSAVGNNLNKDVDLQKIKTAREEDAPEKMDRVDLTRSTFNEQKLLKAFKTEWKSFEVPVRFSKFKSLTWSPSNKSIVLILVEYWTSKITYFDLKQAGNHKLKPSQWTIKPDASARHIEWTTIDTGKCINDKGGTCLLLFGTFRKRILLYSLRDPVIGHSLVHEGRLVTKKSVDLWRWCYFYNNIIGMAAYWGRVGEEMYERVFIVADKEYINLAKKQMFLPVKDGPFEMKWCNDGSYGTVVASYNLHLVKYEDNKARVVGKRRIPYFDTKTMWTQNIVLGCSYRIGVLKCIKTVVA